MLHLKSDVGSVEGDVVLTLEVSKQPVPHVQKAGPVWHAPHAPRISRASRKTLEILDPGRHKSCTPDDLVAYHSLDSFDNSSIDSHLRLKLHPLLYHLLLCGGNKFCWF